MKMSLQLISLIGLTILINGCGKQTPTVAKRKVFYRTSTLTKSNCPLKFAEAGLCANIKWTQGPSVDQESMFELTFTKTENFPSNELVEPTAQVGSFIRMTCCGSVFFPSVSKISDGKYLVSKLKFTPGKWEVYVQLKNGNSIEKQFITLNLDE